MTVYFVEKKGWRFDFMRKGERYTQAFFKTKREAEKAEQRMKDYLERPKSTDMAFLDLVELRLDEVKQRLSNDHYMDTLYHARRWVKDWSGLTCSEITIGLITKLRDERSKISNQTANKELRYLSSLFSWGIRKGYIIDNPASRVDKLRVEKQPVYVPSLGDIEKVLREAAPDQKDYLYCLRDTFARSREINNLTWNDIDFDAKTITLYTRKKKHGTKTPRLIPLTEDLLEILRQRYKSRDISVKWVFWHRYYSRNQRKVVNGPYRDRKKFMRSLCRRAGVRYFRFHPLRHAGASFMESIGIPISHIQEILGHENRKTTEGYIHSIGNSKNEAIEKYQQAKRKLQVDKIICND
ncbi:tyrosine-type recombinase/integrase [Desulfofustis glycolicus]|uniref:Site-specific recombinase XerD n=1 Tax=Desulfofustis glycolicus DSM 9705 TaxID=1121409 RepID=A0A1M5YML4_9BACT|nr:site-specific integrase [Desulfofustis glycolicus]SHI13054.1 Site-specific recombinase XerD [Desulfofustis glycolicus DSM 9705]